jgi:uncharacterized protein YndB with AHSA1/START domain
VSHELRVHRVVKAPPERVFEAWTTPAMLQAWYGLDDSWTTPAADVDLRVGGRYRITLQPSGPGSAFDEEGEYLVVDPPHRLVYTCDDRTVTVDFVPCAEGTEVVVVESGYATAEARDRHAGGWPRFLERLGRFLA